MSVIASLETYRRRRFPPRDFQIDPVMTVFVALDGLLKALDRLEAAGQATRHGVAHSQSPSHSPSQSIAAERARIQQGIDFVFGGIDLQTGSLASGLLVVLMHDLRHRLLSGLDRGETHFGAEAETLRRLHRLFAQQTGTRGRALG